LTALKRLSLKPSPLLNDPSAMNEILFIVTAVLDLSLALVCFYKGKTYLYTALAINLILVSIFGGKLIEIFGFSTNVGNVFYASVFFMTHLLIEHYGKEEGFKTIKIGLFSIILFTLMAQLTMRFTSLSDTITLSASLDNIFSNSLRIAAASLLAFLVAQLVNVNMYSFLYRVTNKELLWFRDNFSNIVGQLIDSIVFFTLAFLGAIPNELLIQAIFTGFLIKVLVGFLGTPFLYLSLRIKK
jgi:queuosine precursor transporter